MKILNCNEIQTSIYNVDIQIENRITSLRFEEKIGLLTILDFEVKKDFMYVNKNYDEIVEAIEERIGKDND